ncbi:MAG: hypothetical protein LBG06_01175, partial [Deltaproteobacteria bacterium]|nr:hypothetical protein [Deltaproteobacteria bacterium]
MPPARPRLLHPPPAAPLTAAALLALLWLSPAPAPAELAAQGGGALPAPSPAAAPEVALPARPGPAPPGSAADAAHGTPAGAPGVALSPGSPVFVSPGALEAASPTPPPDPASLGLLREEARLNLFARGDPADPAEADGSAFLARVEKATVLYFRAAGADPANPEWFRVLGRLFEIRALFATDPWDRRELLDGAQAQFLRAARLEFESAFDRRASRPGRPGGPPPSGPIISELAFEGRLKRGEATLDELARRHGSEGLPAERNPRFWADRLHIIQAGEDAAAREALFAEARDAFARTWRDMPVELYWRASQRGGLQKAKKTEALRAWAGAVLSLSTAEPDHGLRDRLFAETLRLLELGLSLPLDDHETGELLASLDRAEPEAPDRAASQALWDLKDRLFARWLARKGRPAEVNALWGDDLYARADRQPDARLFEHYLSEGDARYAAYLGEIPAPGAAAAGAPPPARQPAGRRPPAEPPLPPEAAARALEGPGRLARAHFRQGESLERNTGRMTELMLGLSPEDHAARRRRVLQSAAACHRAALELAPGSVLYARALSRSYLGLASLARDDAAFLAHFDNALSLALSVASREPDSAGAFYEWGRSLLTLVPSFPTPVARERAVAEALAAFRQNLRSHSPFVPELNEMADLVYRAALTAPGQKAQAYRLLVEICRRLASLRPDDPDCRFALALAAVLKLSAEGPAAYAPPGEAAAGGDGVPPGVGGADGTQPPGGDGAPGGDAGTHAGAVPDPDALGPYGPPGGGAGGLPWAAGPDAAARRDYRELLQAAGTGLELLSTGGGEGGPSTPPPPGPPGPIP